MIDKHKIWKVTSTPYTVASFKCTIFDIMASTSAVETFSPFHLYVSPILSLKYIHPNSSITRISPDRKHRSPWRQTFWRTFFLVDISSAYPWKSLNGWFRTIFPTHSPGSPGLHLMQRPFSSLNSSPVSLLTLIRPNGKILGKKTGRNPTAPFTFS